MYYKYLKNLYEVWQFKRFKAKYLKDKKSIDLDSASRLQIFFRDEAHKIEANERYQYELVVLIQSHEKQKEWMENGRYHKTEYKSHLEEC